MKTATEGLREEATKPRLTTGSRAVDDLIDGVRQGQFHLFYGDDQEALDSLIHRLLINCVLPTSQGGFSAKALYINNCNYHQEKTILDPSYLGTVAKLAGLDPTTAFENIYCLCVFNEAQQDQAREEILNLLERDTNIRLIISHNLTRFVATSQNPLEARQILKQTIGALKQAASKNAIAVVGSCSASPASRGIIPKPEGGPFLRQEANVVVFLKRVGRGPGHPVRVVLVKHPYKRTLQSVTLQTTSGGVNLLGSMTPSFHSLLQRQLEELTRSGGFQNTLLDVGHTQAFDSLIREAWSPEDAALSHAGIPHILDVLNLMANVHTKKCLEELEGQIQALEQRFSDPAAQ